LTTAEANNANVIDDAIAILNQNAVFINQLPALALVKTTEINISSAQLLALFNTPVLLVPGIPGTFLDMISATIEYVAGSIPYNVGIVANDNLAIQIGPSYTFPLDNPFAPLLAKGFIDQPVSMVAGLINSTSVDTIVSSTVNGQGVYLTYGGGGSGPTLGNGTLRLTVSYNSFVL
jgi:hypothetical protein